MIENEHIHCAPGDVVITCASNNDNSADTMLTSLVSFREPGKLCPINHSVTEQVGQPVGPILELGDYALIIAVVEVYERTWFMFLSEQGQFGWTPDIWKMLQVVQRDHRAD